VIDRAADKAASSIEMELATEQPTKRQQLIREIGIVTDIAADNAASSLEKKRQSN
jgi:hypothetical protein